MAKFNLTHILAMRIVTFFFIYLFKSDSRSITEKNKNKSKQQKLHGIRDTYKKIVIDTQTYFGFFKA